MKIDSFFKKQSKGSGVTKPDAAPKQDDSSKHKRQQQASSDNDTRITDRGNGSAGAGASFHQDIKTVEAQRLGSVEAKGDVSTPLLETTNKQAGDGGGKADAAPASSNKQAAPPASPAREPACTIDLSCDSPQKAAAAAAQAQQQSAAPVQVEAAQTAEAAPDSAEAMEVDAAPAPEAAAQAAAEPSPAAAAAATPASKRASAEPATPAAALLRTGSPTAPDTAVNTSTVKTPAIETFLTPEQRKELLEACEKELPLLEADLDVRPDLAAELAALQQGSSDSGKKSQALDIKHQVSILVEGQSLPLTLLAQHISSLLSGSSSNAETGAGSSECNPAAAGDAAAAVEDAAGAAAAGAGGSVSVLVVRNMIQDVASRKSYGLQDGALANVDALEDATPAYHWCWELRSLTGIPKHIKQQADAARKHRKQVLDRLKAASSFAQLARSFTKPTKAAESKLARAAAKLAKLQPLEALQAAATAAGEATAAARQQSSAAAKAKAAASLQDKQAKEEQAAAAAAAKAEHVRQAEAERAAREAEKAAKAAAKAAEAEEKARLKAEEEKRKEEAKQAKAKKKEAAAAAKKGFHSITEMHRAQDMFKSFLGKPAGRRTPTPAGPSGDTHSQGTGSQHEGSGTGGPQRDAKRQDLWPAAANFATQQQLSFMQQLEQQLPLFSSGKDAEAAGSGGSSSSSAASAGAAAGAAARSAPELLATLQEHWRGLRKRHTRVWGLPPSWAQRPGAADDPSELIATTAAALYGEGVELSRLRLWRRKMIRHHDSVRPAFYGSWSRTSRSVSGRRPLGKDLDLDYEVMSDEDWEEEPDGESLSVDGDDDDEAAAGEEGEEDEEGFVVGDGYFSDDEGMRDAEDQEDGSDAAAAAAAGGGGSSGPRAQSAEAAGAGVAGSGSDNAVLAALEAGLERARQRGRPVVLVADCPAMSWEPTSSLEPSLLSSLRGSLLRTDIVLEPPTPAQLPHLFGTRPVSAAAAGNATAAATAAELAAGGASPAGACPLAAAAAGAAVAAGLAAGDAAAAAAAAAGVSGAGGASAGQRGRQPTVFPDALLPALVQHVQANNTLAMDKLVAQFVEAQAAAGVKVAKSRVKDKIKEMTTMRMVAKAPLYTVKPEYLQVGAAAGAGDATEGAAAAAAAAADGAGDAMQVDEAAQQQQQQEQGQQAAAAAVAGMKRAAPTPASPADIPGTAAASAAAAVAAGQPAAAGAGPTAPPAKKQKTPGIERFFGAKSAKKPEQQQQQRQDSAPNAPQQLPQQQQQPETPPGTPRHQCLDARLGSPAAAAAAAGGGGGADAVPGAVAAYSGGVLPMLTPPSHDAATDRPAKSNSPVPFRMNSGLAAAAAATPAAAGQAEAAAAAAADTADAAATDAAAAAAAERRPVNRWHAQADCRGMGLQGGDAGSVQQQPQQHDQQQQQQQLASPQSFVGLNSGQQQQQAASSPAAAAAAAGKAVGCKGGTREVPRLPADGSPPGSTFWKQLASWIMHVKEPPQDDITSAFAVFDEEHLMGCIQGMPQVVLSAMVKTLGSSSQSLAMRAACVRCIANTATCLTHLQPQQQASAAAGQDQPLPLAGTSSPMQQQQPPPAQQVTPPRPAAAAAANGATPASAVTPRSRQGADASPSPSPSPRSAPVEVSFEEMCAEPGLLPNLLLCMNPDKALQAARDAAAAAGGSGGSSSSATPELALLLSQNAARALATLVKVGVPNPFTPLGEVCPSAAAASAQLRLKVAGTNTWRGSIKLAVRQTASDPRSTFALMALHALLADPASAKKFIGNERLAQLYTQTVVARGSSADKWVIRKWCLLAVSEVLLEECFQAWALPQASLEGVALGNNEATDMLLGLGELTAACVTRASSAGLSAEGPDRTVVRKCLSLVSLLLSCLANQMQLNDGRLPHRLQPIFGAALGGGGASADGEEGATTLVNALQGLAMQDEWEEGAERARHILDSLSSSKQAAAAAVVAVGDVEMQDS